ncbi:hypothetical protein [Paraburkholderia hospita]|uniref:Uncharacterized protein n=1 Tax=Paraburkholderia hospita TaxID=169430 RepID=A0AAN1JNP9_9BURK|nr:hypothetical protein [Paraburkholderia hospita]AUT76669.1 hypothetical protein C2L64_52190 [Paraburkholderia hospita]OUL80920.1 hypothetical protein CA603_31030 [Paraburkholderia hospita]SEI26028.1 hypothetical protein SAMN05192544_106514 [Paraburkholderia hospita]
MTITGFSAALMPVMATSIAGLHSTDHALERMYAEETAALRYLTPCSEASQPVRVDPGKYETLVAQSKRTVAVLERVHAELAARHRPDQPCCLADG